MPRTVPLIYGVAVVLLLVAGVLLTARSGDEPPLARVPEGCASVPGEVVGELFPDVEVTSSERVGETGERYGRWEGPDGDVLLEIRCARAQLEDAAEHGELVERAEAGREGLALLGIAPEAVLVEGPDGTRLHQLDTGRQLRRTWFVGRDLDVRTARRLVDATEGAPAG